MNPFLRNMIIGMAVVIVLLLIAIAFLSPDFEEINRKANADLPKMVDRVTRMDSIKVEPQSATYNYSFVEYTPTQEDAKKIKEGIVSSTCSKMQKEIKSGMNYHFVYHLEDKKEYAKVSVNKEVCQKWS